MVNICELEPKMKRFLKVFVPVVLSLVILIGIGWYLISYDRVFTQDVFLYGARQFAALGNAKVSSWFYDRAYNQMQDYEQISIELADKHLAKGNYTKAEVALNRAIRNGGGKDVYIKLCNVFLAQDKLLDAVELLDKIPDPQLRQQMDSLRPAPPTTNHKPDIYNQYISVSLESPGNKLYVNATGQFPSLAKDAYTRAIDLQDGENILFAVSISDEGVPSPLAVFSYTIGGIVQEVDFQDALIEQAVRDALSIHDDRTLFTNELWNIREFTVPEGAQDYTDLQYMIHLQSLTIDGGVPGQLTHIGNLKEIQKLSVKNLNATSSDLDAIANLTSLTELTLHSCGISTVAPLSGLTSLTYLDLSNNAIRGISAIASMTKLETLYLQRNVIEDLSPLSGCVLLHTLDISYNTLTSIAPLKTLTGIIYLNINNNSITDISAVATMTGLLEFNASQNNLSDISAIAKCTKLTYLNVAYNSITDLTPTKDHMFITTLNFSHNAVKDLPAWSTSNSFVTVDGSYNQISTLAVFAGHRSINNILMDYNADITSVDVLASCYLLIQVDVYGTKVKQAKALQDMSVVVNFTPV